MPDHFDDAKSPAERYATAAELVDELRRYRTGEPIRARRIGPVVRAWRWCKRKPIAAGLCAAVVVAVFALAGAWMLKERAAQVQRVAALQNSFEVSLDDLEMSQASLEQAEATVALLDTFSKTDADQARGRLTKRFAEIIQQTIKRPSLTPDDVSRIKSAIDAISVRDESAAEALRASLSKRFGGWQLVAAIDQPFANLAELFPAAVTKIDEGLLFPARPARTKQRSMRLGEPVEELDQVEPTRLAGDRGMQAKAVFAESALSSPRIGLVLSWEPVENSFDQGYAFLISAAAVQQSNLDDQTSDGGDGGALAEAGSAGRIVTIEIRKNGFPLQRRQEPASKLRSSLLTLRAVREGNWLTFQVNDLAPLKIYDVFPLAGDRPGVLAIDWPRKVGLLSLEVSRQEMPLEPGPLQKGDQLFAADDFVAALAIFERLELADETEVRQEATFKRGLCLLRLERRDEAAAVFESLINESGEQWPPLAACQLWVIRLQQKRDADADAVFEVLSARYRFDQLAALIPSDVRGEILDAYLNEFNSFSNVLQYNPHRIRNMERAVAIDRLFSQNGRGNVNNQVQLSRAYRFAGELFKALELVERLVDEHAEERGLFREHCRLLRLTGQPERALVAVNEAIQDHIHQFAYTRPDMWLERARVYAALGDWPKVEQDVDAVLNAAAEYADVSSTGAMHFYVFGHLMKGYLYERRGDRERAEMHWRTGYEQGQAGMKILGPANSTSINLLVLGSLADALTDDDVAAFMNHLAPSGTVQVLLSAVQRSTLTAALRRMWRTPRGREHAEQFAFESISMAERVRIPVLLAAHEYVRLTAFGGDFSDEQDRLVWQIFESLFHSATRTGEIGGPQAVQLGLTWRGTTSFLGWAGVAPSLSSTQRGLAAYLFAHRYIQRNDKTQAQQFFRTAVENAEPGSLQERLARSDGELLAADHGALHILSEFPEPLRLLVSQDEREVAAEDVSAETVLDLPAGKYRLSPADALPEGVTMSASDLTIVAGRRVNVRLHWPWKPDLLAEPLPGVIPRPANLPGVGRWQVCFQHAPATVNSVAWSPDGQWIAAGAADAAVRIYDAETKQLVMALLGHTRPVTCIAWHHDSRTLATAGDDETVRVWDSLSGRLHRVFQGHEGTVTCVTWRPDGLRLASGSWDRTIRIWDPQSDGADPIGTLTGHTGGVRGVAWSPDGKWLASAGYQGDQTVRVWNAAERTPGLVLGDGDEDYYTVVAWSPDGKTLATGGAGRSVRLWNTQTWKEEQTFGVQDSPIGSMAWNSDGERIASSSGGKLYLWALSDSSAEPQVQQTSQGILSVCWKPDGSQLVSSGYNGTLDTWSADGSTGPKVGYGPRVISAFAWSTDGSRLAVAGSGNTVRVLQPDGQTSALLQGKTSYVPALSWSPDGQLLAAGGNDTVVGLFDAAGTLVAERKGHTKGVYCVAYRSDGRLASAGDDGTVLLWPVDGEHVVLETSSRRFFSLAWNARGRLAASDRTGSLLLWNEDGTLARELKGGVTQLAWSPDGRRLVAGGFDSRVRVFNESGDEEIELQGHHGSVYAVDWSPKGDQVVSASDDGTAKIWNLDGTVAMTFDCQHNRARAVAWAPAGDSVATAGEDGVMHIWSAHNGALQRVVLLLPDNDSAVFGPGGRIEHFDDTLDAELVYVVERPDRTVELLTRTQFLARLVD